MDDKTWAQIAIQLGVINPGLAEEFERTKQELGLTKSLAEVLKENGLINDGDIESVAALEPVRLGGTPKDDYQAAQFGTARKLADAKVISEEQATECLRDLVIEAQGRDLRVLLIERRYVTPEQLDALDAPKAAPAPARPPAKAPAPAEPEADFIELPELTLVEPPPATPAPAPVVAARPPEPTASVAPPAPIGTKRKMKCVKCKLTLEVISRGKQATCPRCKVPLEDIGFSPQLRTDATFTTQRLKAADIAAAAAKLPSREAPKTPPAPAKAAGGRKVVCIICDASIPDEREPGGRVHCPSCGASFAPK
jgi:DNA-directed RNA polymerase subunit RPC12/RpoP